MTSDQNQQQDLTEEEIEELALEAAEQSKEFKEIEARQAQGLWNYPFEGADLAARQNNVEVGSIPPFIEATPMSVMQK